MLDTSILVDFFLVYSKEDKKQKIPDSLKRSEALLKVYESGQFENVMTYWNLWELRQVIMKIRLEQKYIESGYSTREFGDARKEIVLEQQELALVNKAVLDLWKNSKKGEAFISETDYILIERLTQKGYTFMDLILILQAKRNKCDFFVTRDNRLVHLKPLYENFGLEIIGIKEFLDSLERINHIR